ncbi:MAG: ImmA/IrrE family metallo-endopeptidase [Chlorobia bacterium]|nr:ImmA/IrrE family metallo-endopeptidase [Fimbriimonadaceae bacterium]
MTRSQLGLSPDTSIKNLTGALERAGVLILKVPLEVDGLDAFSAWVGRDRDVPTICLIGSSVGYRGRYTMSEELGHLILHTPLRTSVEEAESEVKDFVGEFILPEEAMRREMSLPVTLTSLATLRHRWGASIQFLAARSHQLGITTPNQYRYLMQQVSKNGWRTTKREPGDESIAQEKPQLVLKMIEAVYGSPPDVGQMRKDLGIPMSLLRSLLQSHGTGGLAPMSSVLTMVLR